MQQKKNATFIKINYQISHAKKISKHIDQHTSIDVINLNNYDWILAKLQF